MSTDIPGRVSLSLETTPEHYGQPELDKECSKSSHHLSFSSGPSEPSHPSLGSKLRELNSATSASSNRSNGSDRRVISETEQHYYYKGLRRWVGDPKLIYRSGNDVFAPPLGSHGLCRAVKLLPVCKHDKLDENNLWLNILHRVVSLLEKREIRFTSIDLARFTWEEEDPEAETETETVTTPPTIWVGVLADSLTSDVAYHSSNDILDLLKEHDISDIEVAYRESYARLLTGPELYAPVNYFHPLKDVITPFTTALGMPIASLKTPHMQGTMGFFFRQDGKLYGVTARHVLFSEEDGNDEYSYVTGPKKEAVVLGTQGFSNLLEAIEHHIEALIITVSLLEEQINTHSKAVMNGNADGTLTAAQLARNKFILEWRTEEIEELRGFCVTVRKEWQDLNDRIIGHVVWAPPVSVSVLADGYMRDVCVIELDLKKFGNNLKGNVINLGPEIDPGKFVYMMNSRSDATPKFKYPLGGHLKLRDIVSATEIINSSNGGPAPYVIKRGSATQTTIGRLNGFDSYERRYNSLGHMDSMAMAIFSYDDESGPFSEPGDSGAVIADAHARFAGFVTGGTGNPHYSDIIYATPMVWLWNKVLKVKYPRADLEFED
ncbi:unnamed protein product [Rhizoctonia solani]|uniref:Uncharacterized protein n=1 Tax=Rhizoctonia solani TaxID=456999 RepID=A0A8H3CZT9_9AGAM|nr:unnamed protein product [Rhizoctonia solani]